MSATVSTEVCPIGQIFYRCGGVFTFSGCCSQDACSIQGCPDANSSSGGFTTTSTTQEQTHTSRVTLATSTRRSKATTLATSKESRSTSASHSTSIPISTGDSLSSTMPNNGTGSSSTSLVEPSTSTPSSTPSPQFTQPSTKTSGSSHAKIGSIIGAVLVTFILLALLTCLLYRRRKKVREITSEKANRQFGQTRKRFTTGLNPISGFMRPSSKVPREPMTPPVPPDVPLPRTVAELDGVAMAPRRLPIESPPVSARTLYSIPPITHIDGWPVNSPPELHGQPISELDNRRLSNLSAGHNRKLNNILIRPYSANFGSTPGLPLGLPNELMVIDAKPSPSRRTTLSTLSTYRVQQPHDVQDRASPPKAHVISWVDSDGRKQESPLELHINSEPH